MSKLSRRTSFAADVYELLSSMRFAIGLLSLLAIASVIGTVLKQNEPYPGYLIEFGQFWFTAFDWLGLFDVYHSAWFLVILCFLVLSTSLCIWRNTPGFLHEMRGYREKASDASLAAMTHSAEFEGRLHATEVNDYLKAQGFKVREAQREDGVLLAAKQGSANKLGYFLAHIALVVICIGGLIDGNVPLKLAEALGRVAPETRDIPQNQVPEKSRLSTGNISFRGNVTVPENSSADVVFLNAGRGYFVQELPFVVSLKKFHIEHYSTGMPKLFASDLVITDKATGKTQEATVKVNHPLLVDGVAIYQASFGDGGSPLTFKAWNWALPHGAPQTLQAKSMNAQPLRVNGQDYQLEFGDLRTFNIEKVEAKNAAMSVNKTFADAMSAAGKVTHEKQQRNLGPSITFKLRDKQGQAREFHSYMAPMTLEGRSYLVTGVRREVGEPFGYLRLPLDADGQIDGFMRLRAALNDPKIQAETARRVAQDAKAAGAIGANVQAGFEDSVKWVLAKFSEGGFGALEAFLEAKVPADKRQEVAQTYIKLVQGSVGQVDALARAQAGLPALPMTEAHYRFLLDCLVGVGGATDYGSPVFLQMTGFDEVKASGLQITRSPGKNIVYLGALLMVLGIFCMFYIRELRLWVRLSPRSVRVAMASNRKTLDLAETFSRHQDALSTLAKGK